MPTQDLKRASAPAASNNGALKILVVTAMYPRPGNEGSGAFVMHQVEQLQAMGHTVDVLDFPSYRSKFEYLKAAGEVFRRTGREHYDVLHAHYGLTGISTLARHGVPMVVTMHGSDALVGRVQPFISRCVGKMADATIVVSEKIAQRIPGDIIPCGVDLELFAPKPRLEARQKLGLDPKRKYVLFPFNTARGVKRFDIASEAVRQLAAEKPEVELITVSKVHFREMPWHYGAADSMILCSDSEGSPTAVKEALACNLPVVSTDVGDVRDIVRGIAGVEVMEQTPVSLAAGLKRVLFPPDGFVFDGRAAMQRYSQRLTAEAIVRVYHKAIDKRRPKCGCGHHHHH
jgi:glycosyltransferase involved in cell wall biosynthesis